MMFKIAILMGVRASWAWKENLFFSFIVNDWDKRMIYLQGYRVRKLLGMLWGWRRGYKYKLCRQACVICFRPFARLLNTFETSYSLYEV